MCGLVGMIGDPISTDHKMLKTLLVLDTLRGEDSTGLAAISRNGESIKLLKQVGHPAYLFDSHKEFNDRGEWVGPSSKVFIGHNRAATKGKVTEANAHPFIQGDIVGAHNGTLTSVAFLENGNEFEVDSEAIFYNLNKYEVTSVIGNLQGAYALTWYDKHDGHMYIIRNSQRTLYWARRADRDVIYWASEKWMLEVASSRVGIKITAPESFDINTLYSFDMTNFSRESFRKKDWTIQKEVYGYIPPKKAENKKGGEASRTNPFPPSQAAAMVAGSPSFNTSAESLAKLKALEGTDITFRMGDVKYGQGKVPFIDAYPSNFKDDYEIRIFSHGKPKHEEWVKAKHGPIFTGKVKRAVHNFLNGRHEAYLLIDLRTIEKKTGDVVPFNLVNGTDTPDDGQFYMGYGGQFLTIDELHVCAHKGCAGCGDPITPQEMYLFVERDEFLCNSCQASGKFDEYWSDIGSQRQIQQVVSPF